MSGEQAGELAELGARAAVCTLCPLAETRTKVVFGWGSRRRPDAGGGGPRLPRGPAGGALRGAAGKLLDRLLGEIDLTRSGSTSPTSSSAPPQQPRPAPDRDRLLRRLPAGQLRLIDRGWCSPWATSPPACCSSGTWASAGCAARSTPGGTATWCPRCTRRRSCAGRGPHGADPGRFRPGEAGPDRSHQDRRSGRRATGALRMSLAVVCPAEADTRPWAAVWPACSGPATSSSSPATWGRVRPSSPRASPKAWGWPSPW